MQEAAKEVVEEVDSEEERKKEEAAKYWAEKREADFQAALKEKERAGEEKRRLVEAGLVDGNVKQLSKKEKEVPPVCLPACAFACLPVCLPACLRISSCFP